MSHCRFFSVVLCLWAAVLALQPRPAHAQVGVPPAPSRHIAGRVTSITIDPADPSGNTVYVGSERGGVWKSTNAAGALSSVAFQPLTHPLPINAITVQPGGTGVVLAGLGDTSDTAAHVLGSGLLRSADGGMTWSTVQATEGSFSGVGFAGFAWSTTSPQTVVAALSSPAEPMAVGDSTGVRGLYYSNDGGATWKLATLADSGTVVQGPDKDFTSFRGNAATAVVWNPIRGRFYAAVRFHGYYDSPDGITWTRLANQPGAALSVTNCPAEPGSYGLASCPIFRGTLAVQPVTGDTFAWSVDSNNADQGLWQDACALSGMTCGSATVTWATQIDSTPTQEVGVITNGVSTLSLATVPAVTMRSAADTLLFAGTGDLYRCSLSGGCALRNTTNATNRCVTPARVAPAQHAIALQPNTSNASAPRLFLGNDGGLWRSLDGVGQTGAACSADDARHFDNLNGGTGSPDITLSPSSLTFTATNVHSTTSAQTVQVINSSTGTAALTGPSTTGDFAIASTTCGSTLASGGTCTIDVTFTPTAAGTRSGVLSVSDSNGTYTATLNGTGTAANLSPSPTSLAFADRSVNSTSQPRSVTITNTGSAPLNITGVATTGDFAASNNCTGATLAVNVTCIVNVTFTPTALGARTGSLNFTSNSGGTAGTVMAVALSGNGTAAFTVVLTPTSADFGTVLLGSSSAVVNVTVSNTGTQTGALGAITVSGDFSLRANTCGTSLAPQTGCTVSVVFTPTQRGTRTGTLTVNDDAGTQTASLSGTGAAPATDTIAPTALVFGAQQAGTVSAAQSVTLTNSGDVPLTLVSARVLTGDFSVVSNCGTTVAAHTTCTFAVTFTPHSVGTLIGTLEIDDVQHGQTVSLSGTGLAGPGITLLPSALHFANTGVGVAGAGQALTLTNNGSTAVHFASISVSGDFGIVAGSSTCVAAGVLAPGATCTMQVAFAPQAAGTRTGVLTIADDLGTQTAQLSGTGIDFSLNAESSTTATLSSGAAATYALLLRPAINTSDPVTYICTGAPANAKCTVVSQYPDLSATGTVTVTVLTGTTAKRVLLSAVAWPAAVIILLLAVPCWCCRQRVTASRIALLFLCAALLGVAGCGSGRKLPDSGDGSSSGGSGSSTVVTPSGTYNLTVSATAAGATRSVPLTLTVQ